MTFLSNEENRRSAIKANRLWTDKYIPQTSIELAVAPKKVKEVSKWLENPSTRLLILVGSPGIGKSTMVQCLAREQEIHAAEWTESTSTNGLTSFEEFLQHANLLSEQKSIILVDEIPNLFANEVRFRDLFTHHIRTTVVPTVLIMSDTVEGKTNTIDLLIDTATLYDSSLVKIMQIHLPTRARFTRALKGFSVLTNDDALYDKCGGDLRYALCMLQSGCQPHFRDTKLSSFHALGKLLYAKRNGAGHLEFDPEQVIKSMESVPRALSFLQYHSLDFYTDISDISNAMHCFSDAAIMKFGEASVAARAVAATNHNPAETKFKQLSAPPRTTPNGEIMALRSTQSPTLPRSTFATDVVPFLRRIKPNLCWGQSKSLLERKDNFDEEELERQRDLLSEDDIVDDSE